MNETESGVKRNTIEDEGIVSNEQQQAKKQKLDNSERQENSDQDSSTLISLPNNTLVLDKLQEDTIKQLMESSKSPITQEQQTEEASKSAILDENNKTTKDEIVPIKAVTSVTATAQQSAKSDSKSDKVADNLNITSEQLLFALTSVPETETLAKTNSGTNAEIGSTLLEPVKNKLASTKAVEPSESLAVIPLTTSVPLVTAPVPDIPAPVPTAQTINEIISTSNKPTTVQPPNTTPVNNNNMLMQTSINPATTLSNSNSKSINITGNTSETKLTASALSPLPASTGSASTDLDASAVQSKAQSPTITASYQPNNPQSTTPSIPPSFKPTNNNTSSSSLNQALTNLPDISAALRRLSSANISPATAAAAVAVITNNNKDANPPSPKSGNRRSSMMDVSPSEILGNALAAVAANAARPYAPPQQQQQMGSLAAITANISNLLHNGGFHRNSFSQEDTQKLAAAVANVRNQRKSSMPPQTKIPPPPTTTTPPPPPPIPQPKLITKNEQVWKALEGVEEKRLGFHVYSPNQLLPAGCLNGVVEVRVPARYLTFDNIKVRKRAVWGTEIYTDDSDVVAMAIHSGKYQPEFIEKDLNPNDPFALAITGKQREATEMSRKMALSGKKFACQSNKVPDHDVKVTLRVLPTLQYYSSSIRFRIKSRDWKQHDGLSFFVCGVEKIKRGEARVKGRSTFKSDMFAFESYRKQVLGIAKKVPQTDIAELKEVSHSPEANKSRPFVTSERGRVKKTRRVMRMFQIHSEMKNSNGNNDSNTFSSPSSLFSSS